MAKRMLVLVTVLTAMLAVAAPAMAQETQYVNEAQYAPEEVSLEEVALTAEEFDGFGVVEAVGEKSDGTPVYGLSVSPDEGYYLEGGFDFAAFEGQNVYVAGEVVFHRDGGSFLRVERIEPSADGYAAEEPATGSETTAEETPAGPEEITTAPVSFGGEEVEEGGGGGSRASSLLPDSGGALVLILGLGALLTVGGGLIHRAVS